MYFILVLVIIPMIDTVNLKLTQSEVEDVNFLDEIPRCLNPGCVAYHDFCGTPVVTGKIDNLSVTVSPNQVRVKDGSLCKWMLGDNYQAMGRADIKRAVERLSDTLHQPFDRATITRLDVGLSIPVREPTANYLNHMGVLNYAQRLQQPHSLYYYRHHKAERLCFYDKNREQRDHREAVPDLYQDKNVLRYEQRYMARLPMLLGVASVTGAILYDEGFYISLLNRWREAYRAISKVNTITLNLKAMKTKRDLHTMGVLGLVERFGGEVEIMAHFAEAQKRGDLTAKQAFDLRQAVKQACKTKEGIAVQSEAITELDKKIADAIRYYR